MRSNFHIFEVYMRMGETRIVVEGGTYTGIGGDSSRAGKVL